MVKTSHAQHGSKCFAVAVWWLLSSGLCITSAFAKSRSCSSKKSSLKQLIFHTHTIQSVPLVLFTLESNKGLRFFFSPIKAMNWDSKMCEHLLSGVDGKSNDSAYAHACTCSFLSQTHCKASWRNCTYQCLMKNLSTVFPNSSKYAQKSRG